MTNRLQEMTLEELWEIFPIVLEPHNPEWKVWAKEEIDSLSCLLSEFDPKIHHIGSTAIPHIHAKPIVDILVEVLSPRRWNEIKTHMESAGYICMSETENRLAFNKGYTPEGYAERVYHIHIHLNGDNDEIAFRDYLFKHPKAAKEYEKLKLSLLPKFRNNRDAYTKAKTNFIKSIIKTAGQFAGRNEECGMQSLV